MTNFTIAAEESVLPMGGGPTTIADNAINLEMPSSVLKKSIISDSDMLRIENAATRINKPISVVGSRASGTAGAYSDWDYTIQNLNSSDWSKIKNSLPGARSIIDNTARNIDVFKAPVNPNLPHVTVNPRP